MKNRDIENLQQQYLQHRKIVSINMFKIRARVKGLGINCKHEIDKGKVK